MTDPYKTLGVSYDATDDEIKKAYRELAKKYHPDNYRDSALSELAAEKMKEINEAYDTIQKQRQSGTGTSSGTYSGYSGYSGASSYPHIRRLINEGRYSEAELNLDAQNQSMRNAEWHYLKAIVLLRRGWIYDALNHVDVACNMDPSNEEYQRAKETINSRTNAYGSTYYGDGGRSHRGADVVDACNCCSNLLILDCCCECMGGDLIPCC